jgi:nucleotide-binding universal stress UspA family protein
VKVGDVRDELLGIIRDQDIDLVVMGTHGRGALERFFLGSVTEKMLRKSPVPVLTVSHLDPSKEIRMAEPATIRRIIYANDLSLNADVGLHYAAELARTFGSELVVLHAVDGLELGYSAVELGQLSGANTLDVETARLNAVLQIERTVEAEHVKDMKVVTVALKGVPHQVITSYAEETSADLIVLNMQSKGILERAMLGATAERVIRAAHAPVLSIPVGAGARFLRVTPAA